MWLLLLLLLYPVWHSAGVVPCAGVDEVGKVVGIGDGGCQSMLERVQRGLEHSVVEMG